ncbi:MAG TPA: hypothetical protein VEZ41_04170 [Allosphingosinicella sp.]|nr:hypothetical protein [Allosphingosinicella sp.]
MTRSATDVMHDIIYAAVIDAVGALKSGAGNLPNTLLRDLGAIHANTTFADLPEGVRKAIEASVRSAFTRLLKEGYSVSSGTAPPPRPPAIPARERPQRGPGGKPPPRRPSGDRDPRGNTGRPPRKPGGGGSRPGGGGGGGKPK